MKRLKQWFGTGNKPFKLSVYDPSNFNEIFDITASKIQIASFIALFTLIVGVLFVVLVKMTPLESYFFPSSNNAHSTFIENRIRVDTLTKKVEAQEKYIADLKRVLFGDFQTTEPSPQTPMPEIDPNTMNESPSMAEQKISEKVQSDRQVEEEGLYMIPYFVVPAKGKISQRFVQKKHEGIDVVLKANTPFVSCLSGVVIYADYSQMDGNILIIKHEHNFLSVYKHAKTLFKKRGEKVKAGEKIGIVGNTGANSTGTHLHFELWIDQKAVNPKKYIEFE